MKDSKKWLEFSMLRGVIKLPSRNEGLGEAANVQVCHVVYQSRRVDDGARVVQIVFFFPRLLLMHNKWNVCCCRALVAYIGHKYASVE